MGKVKTISNLKDRVSVQFGFEPGPQDGGFRDIHSTLFNFHYKNEFKRNKNLFLNLQTKSGWFISKIFTFLLKFNENSFCSICDGVSGAGDQTFQKHVFLNWAKPICLLSFFSQINDKCSTKFDFKRKKCRCVLELRTQTSVW